MIAKLVARPMRLISLLTAPFVWLLTLTSDILLKMLRIKQTSESKVTEEEIKAIIQEGREGGEVQEIEQDIVERVFSLGDRKVSSLMTHRIDTVFLKSDDDVVQVRETVNAELHSVYPVTDGKGNVIGIALLKDLFRYINDPDFQLKDFLQAPKYVTENTSAYEALRLFKVSKIHQAIVVDEYGQIHGIITMNDLLEALVGDVSEFYGAEFSFIQREDGSWLIDGQFPLSELLQRFDLGDLSKDYSFDTLSGLILHELKMIPSVGDKFTWLNFEIEILDMDGVRIDKVLLTVK
jgi:putative hemolysin